MATATGDIQIDVSGVPNTNPYDAPGVTEFGDPLRVFNGKFRIWDLGGFITDALPTSDIVSATIEIGNDAGDYFGPALINSSLNGWYLVCRFDVVSLVPVTAGVGSTDTGGSRIISVAQSLIAGDLVTLEFNNSTGLFRVFHNGAEIGSTTNTTYNNLRAGYIAVTSDYGDTGALSWAATGYAVSGPSITAADNITDETQPATVTLANNTAAPTAITINGSAATGITDEGAGVYSYIAPLIADDATATLEVTVDGETLTTTVGYANSCPFTLVTHGTPHPNSPFFGTQFATNGPVEWGVVTDYDPAIVIVNHAAMDAAEDELNDVALHSTEVAAGTTTATYKYFVPESGATGTWQSEITVTDGVTPPIDVPVIGEPSQRRVGYRNSNRSAVRSSVGSSIH